LLQLDESIIRLVDLHIQEDEIGMEPLYVRHVCKDGGGKRDFIAHVFQDRLIQF
jgi:hypothetical protein